MGPFRSSEFRRKFRVPTELTKIWFYRFSGRKNLPVRKILHWARNVIKRLIFLQGFSRVNWFMELIHSLLVLKTKNRNLGCVWAQMQPTNKNLLFPRFFEFVFFFSRKTKMKSGKEKCYTWIAFLRGVLDVINDDVSFPYIIPIVFFKW